MRKILALFLVFCLLIGTAIADGDPNVDGSGGGSTGSGSGSSAWNGGDDGVRVTILQGTVPISILDYSNAQRSNTQISFKAQCKLYYKNGGELVPRFDQYTNIVPTISLPRVISTDGSSNIEAIKQSFTTSNRLQDLARDAGLEYEDLISGTYKLMLEPISYFKYKDTQYAMTATEAALYDVMVSNQLRYWMGTLTHQNQPLSMFLERADLGIQPWSGARSGKQSDIDILNYLGVGIVTFAPEPTVEAPEGLGDYTYRTDTDVITSVYVSNEGGADITPDSNVFVTFAILGKTYNVQYVCPAGSSQLVWVKWHTPSTPQDIEINVSDGTIISASIQDVPDVEPPNPGFHDTNPGLSLKDTPDWGSCTSLSWSEWVPVWNPPVVIGLIEIPGYWSWSTAEYTAMLRVDYELTPDSRVKTAVRYPSYYELKSGYGVNANCEVRVTGSSGVTNLDLTPVQHVVAVFPEFEFETYDRLLTPDSPGSYHTTWAFKTSKYSYYGRPVHFTPLWYPDHTKYPVPLAVFDVWTPAGQLYASVSDYVMIDGSVYDDGYIRATTY